MCHKMKNMDAFITWYTYARSCVCNTEIIKKNHCVGFSGKQLSCFIFLRLEIYVVVLWFRYCITKNNIFPYENPRISDNLSDKRNERFSFFVSLQSYL